MKLQQKWNVLEMRQLRVKQKIFNRKHLIILGGYEMIFPGDISKLPYLTHGKSRAINAENRTGEKGKGGMAASPLGPSRKGSRV